jgi:hypothetical protein
VLRSFMLRTPIPVGLGPQIAFSVNTIHSIFLRARVLILTLGFLLPIPLTAAASATSKSRPRLGCYDAQDDGYRRSFCLFDRGVMDSIRMGYREGFGDCGKYNVRARNGIRFWWPPRAFNGALISTGDGLKDIEGTCTWRADKDDNLILSNCEMAGEWKRLSDNQQYKRRAKLCAPPTPAEAFISAARAGDLAAMQKLLARGVDVNATAYESGGTALMAASVNGQTEAVRALLRKGANVNAKDKFGRTALLSGAGAIIRRLEIVRALLDRGADVNARSNETGFALTTALMEASYHGNLDVVRALLDKGADVNATGNKDGATPLMAASEQGHIEVVRTLLEKGADVDAKGNDGTTALNVAKDDEIKAALKDAGATH